MYITCQIKYTLAQLAVRFASYCPFKSAPANEVVGSNLPLSNTNLPLSNTKFLLVCPVQILITQVVIFITGLPVRPMWFVERVFIPIEEQYKYVSDEDDSDDEEWTLGPKKKKRNDTIAVSTGTLRCLTMA